MNRRILLIDESAMLRRIATNILQAQPNRYEVVAATRAVEGFAIACGGRIDLILLDCKTADATGMEICHRLRQEPRTAEIPVILLVGRGVEADRRHLLPENVVDTLVKPFAPEEISGVVNAIFGFTRAGSSLAELRTNLHPNTPGFPFKEDTLQEEPPASATRRDRDMGALASLPSNGDSPRPATERGFASRGLFKGAAHLTAIRTVMHTTAEAGLTGVLRFWAGKEEGTEVFFDQGNLVVVSTRDAATYSSRATEVMPAKVSAATLEDAVAEQAESGTPFLLTLGTRGLLSKSSATAFLDQFGQRQFARHWTQRHRLGLRHEFEPLDALPNYALRLAPLSVSLDQWLLSTTRHLRHEDIAPILHHEGSVGTPVFHPDADAILGPLDLTPNEQTFLRQINARHDLPGIARALGTTQESAFLTLYRFRCLEALNYRPAPAAFVMTPRSYLRRVLPLQR